MTNTDPASELSLLLSALQGEARALATLLAGQRPDAADDGGVLNGLAIILGRFDADLDRAQDLLTQARQ